MLATSHALAANDLLDARLLDPLGLDAPTLMRLWRRTVVTVRVPRPRHMDDGFGLPGRIRGALGRALEAAGPETSPWSGRRVRVYDLLFGPRVTWCPGLEVPKPWTLAVDHGDGELVIRLTLFGLAGAWAGTVADGLRAALANGIRLSATASVLARMAPTSECIRRHEGVAPVTAPAGEVALIFRTPVSTRHGRHMTADGPRLISGLIHHVAGLARWNDIAPHGSPAEWGEMARSLRYETADMRYVSWMRWSARQPGRPIPMGGLLGTLWISGAVEPLLPFLAIGETAHAGSGAVFGLGRYDLAGCRRDDALAEAVSDV